MNRAKRIVNSIINENSVKLMEDVNATLQERAMEAINTKKLQVVSEMFDNGDFSNLSLREGIADHKRQMRANVISALSEAFIK